MKKLLIPILLFSFSMANAQSKKTSSKKKEASAYAKINKDRRTQMNEMRIESMQSDSMRLAEDSINDVNFDSTRLAWKTTKEHEIDSTNKAFYGSMAHSKEMNSVYEHSENLINKSAKLSDNQSHQVAYLNDLYREKAYAISSNAILTPTEANQQLTQLNTEKMAKLRVALGKHDYRNYVKVENNFKKKNPGKTDNTWNVVE